MGISTPNIHDYSVQQSTHNRTSLCKSSFTMFTLLILLPILTLSVSSASLPFSSKDCEPTTYVVLGTDNIAPYNEFLHGTSPTLRLFDKMPSATCERTMKFRNAASLSPGVDLQVRDTRTSVALNNRGIFTWATSLLKYSPFAFLVSGSVSVISCSIQLAKLAAGSSQTSLATCLATAALTIIGIAYPSWQVIANSLGAGSASYTDVQELTAFAFSGSQDFLYFDKKRSLNISHPKLFEGSKYLFHAADHTPVSAAHILMANATHPLHVYQHGHVASTNATVRMWPEIRNSTLRIHSMMDFHDASNLRKRECRDSDPGYQEGELCDDDTDGSQLPPGAPTGMYYGYDLYGNAATIDNFEADLGTTYDASNGFAGSLEAMGDNMYSLNAWDMCVCQQTQYTEYIATGSLQLTWDNTYNGYSECFNSNCDNA